MALALNALPLTLRQSAVAGRLKSPIGTIGAGPGATTQVGRLLLWDKIHTWNTGSPNMTCCHYPLFMILARRMVARLDTHAVFRRAEY